jgi:hypothetical protein
VKAATAAAEDLKLAHRSSTAAPAQAPYR